MAVAMRTNLAAAAAMQAATVTVQTEDAGPSQVDGPAEGAAVGAIPAVVGSCCALAVAAAMQAAVSI